MLTYICESTTPGKALYRCECGLGVEAFKANVKRGHTSSCGCLRRKKTAKRSRTHGYSIGKRSRVYVAWKNMRARCLDRNRKDYANYGARGIGFDPRWESFENFLADMGEPPVGASLDRIDNSKGYSPGNCRWATAKSQNNNRRSVTKYEFDGRSMTLTEWAKETGIGRLTLRYRIKSGMPLALALTSKGNLRWRRPR